MTLERAMRFDEPVLLVGETGGGKTTACQLISMVLKKKLSIINCHANTEAADFIGGLRPVSFLPIHQNALVFSPHWKRSLLLQALLAYDST